MNRRLKIFAVDLPSALGLSREEVRTLSEFDLLPRAYRIPGTCIFYYLADDVDELLRDIRDRPETRGRFDYLLSIYRHD